MKTKTKFPGSTAHFIERQHFSAFHALEKVDQILIS